MTNRIAVFKNWEAVCLFDSFCCIGDKNLNEPGSISYISWDYTYFRIYLYRLFFKYNLYRYNSMINEADAKKILLRDHFESFLNSLIKDFIFVRNNISSRGHWHPRHSCACTY